MPKLLTPYFLLAPVCAEALLHLHPALLPPSVQAAVGQGPFGAPPAPPAFYTASHALYVPDAAAGYRTAPHLDVLLHGHREFSFRVRTDARGARGPALPAPVDVAALGDSFTFGYGVNEAATWPARLAALTGLRIANLGVNGYGPQSELARLHSDALPLRPRVIVWQFFTNDCDDAAVFARWQRSGHPDFYGWQQGKPDPAARPLPNAARSLRAFLHRHSRIYELLKYALRRGDHPVSVPVGDTHHLLDLARVQRWSDFSRAAIRAGWQATQAALLAAQTAAAQAGVRLVVMLAPTKEETVWARLPRAAQQSYPDLRGPAQRMVEFCALHHLPCLDLGPAFAAAADAGAALYFDIDLHWNAAGHTLAAQHLADWLFKEI
ncbi:MAG: GDSL-type esterase/lipase family protein [Anaerolineae bacterium]